MRRACDPNYQTDWTHTDSVNRNSVQTVYMKGGELVSEQKLYFLHTEKGHLRFYPGIENLIVSTQSYPGCHVRVVHWFYWNSRIWSSSEVIIMLKGRHHTRTSHLGVFRDLWERF